MPHNPDLTRPDPSLGCLMVGIPAGPLPGYIEAALRDGLAGIILFSRNIETAGQVRALTAQIRQASPHALIAIDEEGGSYSHLLTAGVPAHVGNMALGVLDDTEVTRRVAFEMASGLADLGINVDFAPSADVNTKAENPIIGVRSFGSDPHLVARHVKAFVAGMQARGVAACVKHFPGHGDTTLDSHHDLPAGTAELLPFRDSGAALLMTAHVVFPDLAGPGEQGEPATLSSQIIGLAGRASVIVTDALEMRAIADRHDRADAAARAYAAGVDLALVGEPVTEAELRELRHNEAPVSSAQRIRALGERFATPSRRPAPDPAADQSAAAELAARQQPPRLGRGAFAVELRTPNPGYRALHPGLADLLIEADPAAGGVTIDHAVEDETAIGIPADRPLLIAAQDPQRYPWIADALGRLLRRHPDATLILTGLPVPSTHPHTLYSYGRSPVMLRALVEAMVR